MSARGLAADDTRHGTVNGYCNLRCRCVACREAWRLYEPARASKERYRRRLGMQPQKLGRTHGVRATYTNGGCRCDECKRAEADYRRNRRHGDAK